MNAFKQTFTRIKEGYSKTRRLPRLGKIRLGIKVEKTTSKGPVQFPRETDYFVCPPEVQEVYGEKPTELDVMLPHDDPEVVFVQKLARYGASAGLKCHGNGQEALELNEQTRDWVARKCPCEKRKTDDNPKGDCTEQSSLMVLLPKVSMGGCYQITTRSYNSTVTLNSALDYIRALVGRIAMVPFKLRREPTETHHDGKKQTHYTLNLIIDADYNTVRQLRNDHEAALIPARYQIEGPQDENPLDDPADVHEVDAEALAEMNDKQIEDVRTKLKQNKTEKTEKAEKPAQEKAKAESKLDATPPEQKPETLSLEDADWRDLIGELGEDPESAQVMKKVKEQMGVKSALTMDPARRPDFISRLREQAVKDGLRLKNI